MFRKFKRLLKSPVELPPKDTQFFKLLQEHKRLEPITPTSLKNEKELSEILEEAREIEKHFSVY